jgi:predicted metal-dependent TIM-barrel fold hydrolase
MTSISVRRPSLRFASRQALASFGAAISGSKNSSTLSSIVGFERFRASQFGIRHYCTIGLNSKEANNETLAEGVMELIPRFALKEGVVAIGEIGYDEQSALEDK